MTSEGRQGIDEIMKTLRLMKISEKMIQALLAFALLT